MFEELIAKYEEALAKLENREKYWFHMSDDGEDYNCNCSSHNYENYAELVRKYRDIINRLKNHEPCHGCETCAFFHPNYTEEDTNYVADYCEMRRIWGIDSDDYLYCDKHSSLTGKE